MRVFCFLLVISAPEIKKSTSGSTQAVLVLFMQEESKLHIMCVCVCVHAAPGFKSSLPPHFFFFFAEVSKQWQWVLCSAPAVNSPDLIFCSQAHPTPTGNQERAHVTCVLDLLISVDDVTIKHSPQAFVPKHESLVDTTAARLQMCKSI